MAKHHYRKLISAKTTLTCFGRDAKPLPLTSRTITPLDRYEFNQTNERIRSRLIDIYKEPPSRVKTQRKRQKKRNKSMTFSTK